MSNTTVSDRYKGARIVALISMIAGALLIVAGGVTWGMVSSKLDAENITVSDDATFGGQKVNNPWTAFSEADIISQHALAATDGKTYAELEKDDPLRATAMNGSFLRASLFTSVVSFGVAALVMGLGVLFVLLGYGLKVVARAPEAVLGTERDRVVTA